MKQNSSPWKKDFPILSTKTRNQKTMVYLDSAATSQKPKVVIDALSDFYATQNANIHRGVYELSEKATLAYEDSRREIAKFIGSKIPEYLVLTHGATESINLVAHSYLRNEVQAGDEIILSVMEHHANIVPWQILAEEKGLKIHYIPITSDGSLDMESYANLLNEKTKMVAVTQVSNVLGTINPVAKIVEMAHAYQAKVLVDGAQSCPQMDVDVDEMDCDFFVASSHKMYAPGGVGLLYAKRNLLEDMRPYQTGGSMIEKVSTSGSTFMPPPIRFEAGTQPIGETIAWARACAYLQENDFQAMQKHKKALKDELLLKLSELPKIKVYGTMQNKTPVAAFTHDSIHPHDMATLLDDAGVSCRAGHHCAMPLHQVLSVGATTRASLSFYNDSGDIDALVKGIEKAQEMFGG
ncbi:MAG: cysteine desulfurase [Pseudomonadota bacterium]|nr:cysteine desulfurase [Pseudomonadota bacterium]